ncbi:hypothetical protein AAGS40_23460 [Paraburkholderia sp. PREW-6R]|uniref:hypothetical protein n=1 Tax=Paraburkholderia sp. PREW-6R TaxID=3141544 RepID=UPI0031F486FA
MDAANVLFELILDANEVRVLSPEWGRLYDKIVEGAIVEVMPDATIESLDVLLNKPDTSH